MIPSILNKGLLGVGPLLVRTGSSVAEQGSVSIVLGDDFVLDEKRLSGEIIISFNGETRVMTTRELRNMKRITTILARVCNDG